MTVSGFMTRMGCSYAFVACSQLHISQVVVILNFSVIVMGHVCPYIYGMVTKCVVLVWGLTKYCHNGPTIKWL